MAAEQADWPFSLASENLTDFGSTLSSTNEFGTEVFDDIDGKLQYD